MTINPADPSRTATHDCRCVLAERPLCSPDCWHFALSHRNAKLICTNCNNTGKQVEQSHAAEAERDAMKLAMIAMRKAWNEGDDTGESAALSFGFVNGYVAAAAQSPALADEEIDPPHITIPPKSTYTVKARIQYLGRGEPFISTDERVSDESAADAELLALVQATIEAAARLCSANATHWATQHSRDSLARMGESEMLADAIRALSPAAIIAEWRKKNGDGKTIRETVAQ